MTAEPPEFPSNGGKRGEPTTQGFLAVYQSSGGTRRVLELELRHGYRHNLGVRVVEVGSGKSEGGFFPDFKEDFGILPSPQRSGIIYII